MNLIDYQLSKLSAKLEEEIAKGTILKGSITKCEDSPERTDYEDEDTYEADKVFYGSFNLICSLPKVDPVDYIINPLTIDSNHPALADFLQYINGFGLIHQKSSRTPASADQDELETEEVQYHLFRVYDLDYLDEYQFQYEVSFNREYDLANNTWKDNLKGSDRCSVAIIVKWAEDGSLENSYGWGMIHHLEKETSEDMSDLRFPKTPTISLLNDLCPWFIRLFQLEDEAPETEIGLSYLPDWLVANMEIHHKRLKAEAWNELMVNNFNEAVLSKYDDYSGFIQIEPYNQKTSPRVLPIYIGVDDVDAAIESLDYLELEEEETSLRYSFLDFDGYTEDIYMDAHTNFAKEFNPENISKLPTPNRMIPKAFIALEDIDTAEYEEFFSDEDQSYSKSTIARAMAIRDMGEQLMKATT